MKNMVFKYFRGIEIYEFAQISLILKGKLGEGEQCKHYKNVHRRFASVFAADFMVF